MFIKAATPLFRPEVTGAFVCKSTQVYNDPDLPARRQSAVLSREALFWLEVVIRLMWPGRDDEELGGGGGDFSGTPPGIAHWPRRAPLSTTGRRSCALLSTAVLKRHANARALLTWHGATVSSVKMHCFRPGEQLLSLGRDGGRKREP